MPSNLAFAAFVAAAITLPSPQQTPPPAGTARPSSSAQAASTKPGSVVFTVTNQKGDLLGDANVTVRGGVDRGGVSGSDGTVTLQNLPPGTYRARITHTGYFTLDKEVTVKPGAKSTAEAQLDAAPPPPPPPPPPAPVETKPAAPAGPPGVVAVMSVVDVINELRKDPSPVADRELSCAHETSTRLIVAKGPIAAHQHADVDELLYVINGDATVTLDNRTDSVSAGSFVSIPRGVSHSVIRKATSKEKEVWLLSVQSGKPCGGNQK